MRGFSDHWKDFPDYIIGITKEIWEDRGVGRKFATITAKTLLCACRGHFNGCGKHSRFHCGNAHEFPDRQLLGEDVIWSGTPEEGMLSSHRILSTATHLGSGVFGKATGKAITYRGIADCYAKDNMITDEWLVRDNGAILRQIGQDPRDWAATKVAEGACAFTPDQDISGPYLGKGNDDAWGVALGEILSSMMQSEFSVVTSQYDRACHLEYAGGISSHGHAAADAFWLPLRASFPSAEFRIEHQIGLVDPLMPPRAAIRWSLSGQHSGWGPLARQAKHLFISWASRMLNLDPMGCAENTHFSMRQPSGCRS